MIRSKSGEKLSYDNIERVISHLEQENPITKKEACEMLNIRYNTTRLQRIIDEHLDTRAFKERRKSQNKGKYHNGYETVINRIKIHDES